MTRFDSEMVDLMGGAIEVVKGGVGDPLIFLETGMSNDWSTWKPVLEELGNRAQTLAYSRPGYGKSEPTERARDLDTLARDLDIFLTQLTEEKPIILVGHSLGGMIVQAFAAQNPSKVAGLIVVDAPAPDLIEGLMCQHSEDGRFYSAHVEELDGVAAIEHAALARPGGGHFSGEDRPYEGPMVILHALQSWGSETYNTWRRKLAREAATRYPSAELREISAGHYIHQERPLALLDAVDEVMARAGLHDCGSIPSR